MFDKFLAKHFTSKNIIFFIIAILFIVLITKIIDVAVIFFASFVIACSLEPMIVKIQNMSDKIDRRKASAIVLGGAILALGLLIIPIIVIGSNEIKSFAYSFPQYIYSLKAYIINSPYISRHFIENVDIGGVLTSASNVSSTLIGETINIGKNIGSGFIYLIISVLVIYYFMADKDTVKSTFLKMFPVQMRKRTSEIYDAISLKIGGYVVAQIATMASIGIVVTLGLLILRVDYALLLGLMTSIFDIIPVVGPTIAFVICMIAVYKYGALILVLTAVVFAIAQLLENNFVRPYVFSKLLNLHPLVIYLFIFIAAKYMGILGVVFAPAIAALFVVLIEELYMKSLED